VVTTNGPVNLLDFRGLRERINEIERSGGSLEDIRAKPDVHADGFELQYRDAGGTHVEPFTLGAITTGTLAYALRVAEGSSGRERVIAALHATPPPNHPSLNLEDLPRYVEPKQLTKLEIDQLEIRRLGYALLRATHDAFDSVTVEGLFPGWWKFSDADAALALLVSAQQLGLSAARIGELVQHLHEEAVNTNGKLELTPSSAAVFARAAQDLSQELNNPALAQLDWSEWALMGKIQPIGLPADRKMAEALLELQMGIRKQLMGA
jgi:hypothetical protein